MLDPKNPPTPEQTEQNSSNPETTAKNLTSIATDYDYTCNLRTTWLNINQACNMRCAWCYNSNTHFKTENQMTLELAKELVDISIEAGSKQFILIGGEPTLWQPLFELIQYIHEKDCTVGIVTNGLRFANDKFWQKYQETPCDRISLSVKSVDPERFEEVTGTHLLENTNKGLERAIKFHKCGVTTVFNSLVGLEGLKQIAKVCKEMGANKFIVNMCSPTLDENGNPQKGYSIPLKNLVQQTMEAVKYIEKLYGDGAEMDIQMPLCLFPVDFIEKRLKEQRIQTLCQTFARAGLNFDIHGNVTVCNMVNTVIAEKGKDFTDGKSLLNHLNSPELCNQYRELLRYPADCCTSCRWKDNCRGGCIMNWLIHKPSICHAVRLHPPDSQK